MKIPSSRPSQKRDQGFALVIVLSVIVLLLALVVGFFSRVQNELQSSSTYQSSGAAKNLSDYAVNLVLTQIKAGTSGKSGTADLAWASQPGAIRTFNSSGDLVSVYKLYSASEMVVPSINVAAESNSLANWAANPALYTDLNDPINTQYPILDPSAEDNVKGFSIVSAPVSPTNAAPMPAQWLYVLKDGQVVAPSGGARTATVGIASQSNPIVGRIAFWTDDDTAKVNINTSAGGPWIEPNISFSWAYSSSAGGTRYDYTGTGFNSFWSVPVASSSQEAALAGNQPSHGEYQRYPGHPATTYLSSILPSLSLDDIYAIAPRLVNEGSKGGSVLPTSSILHLADSDRLYQSVDEMIFNLNRSANSGVTKGTLEMSKFFLTANSRSPDVNMLNEPRISMWPITENKLTPFDKLIQFCETINNKAYYFLRKDPDSATVDIGIPRNAQILDYLYSKTGEALPGFGGTDGVLGKYGNDHRQILTEIFDYIRSTNTRDSSQGGNNFYYSSTGAVVPSFDNGTRGFGRFPTVSKIGMVIYGVAVNRGASATGRNKIGPPDVNGVNGDPPTKEKTMVLRALLLLETFIPGQGYGMVFPRCSITLSGLDSLRWYDEEGDRDKPMFPASGTLTFDDDLDWNRGSYTAAWGGRSGLQGVTGAAMQKNGTDKYLTPAWPFVGGPLNDSYEYNLPGEEKSYFSVKGGNIKVTIKGPDGAIVQEYIVVIPSITRMSTPENLAPLVKDENGAMHDFRLHKERLNFAGDQYLNGWIRASDIVQAVSVDGDFRILAAQKEPPPTLLRPVPTYGTEKLAHNFFDAYPMGYYGAILGSFADATKAQYPISTWEVPEGDHYRSITNEGVAGTGKNYSFTHRTYLTDAFDSKGVKINGIPGDWDNGVGRAGDGPYINFPDEGRPRASLAAGNDIPYFGGVDDRTEAGPSFFSPNRMMPSSAMLGSLSTGVRANKPWQTLLFRPSQAGHPGLDTPPDYTLLDFFNMPVVEPYAISEPLSTAGRVNMNYQILPYSYIKRSTGVQAVLRSEQMLAIRNNQANGYKEQGGARAITSPLRYKLDIPETLKGFQARFDDNDIFRSASEICSIWLVPNLDNNEGTTDASYADMANWWDNYLPTGDNSKEASYARIYPRLTTKSNTYTVHYRVQVLKKPQNAANQNQWQEGTDKVQAEYRGSTTIERYIDPNDTNIPDYITDPNPTPLDSFYKFRVLSQKQFNP